MHKLSRLYIVRLIAFCLDYSVKNFPVWFKTWFPHMISVPLFLTVFVFSADLIRWIDPTAGVYDAGVAQTVFVTVFKFAFFIYITSLYMRHQWPDIWNYFKKDFQSDFGLSNQHFRIKTALAILFITMFMLVLLDRASGSTPKDCLIKTATSQIGVHELTGNNDGEKVEQYLSSVKLKKGNPWCAAFMAWCHDQCGIKHPVSGYSPDWFKGKAVYKTRELFPNRNYSGYVFGLYFPSKKRVAHVGLVERSDGNYFITIEGNTNEAGSREGDGVYKKRRLKRQVHVLKSFT